MRYLISGATGLVGKEIVRLCHENNIAVNYLTTNREKIESETNYQGFHWNPEKGEIDVDCFDGVSIIINLAGASISEKWTTEHKKLILSSRINSLKTLYGVLEKDDFFEIKSFVSVSAIGIYPTSLETIMRKKNTKSTIVFWERW